jgi:hypothetical protein
MCVKLGRDIKGRTQAGEQAAVENIWIKDG